ncbi:MAG: hypothetical protein MJE68_09935 [Proteobacteria bacterium]|nr:hypothetical protein [Pseudomonadota bacterium]
MIDTLPDNILHILRASSELQELPSWSNGNAKKFDTAEQPTGQSSDKQSNMSTNQKKQLCVNQCQKYGKNRNKLGVRI